MLSIKVREKSNGKIKKLRLLAVLLVPAIALIMGTAALEVGAENHEISFADAEIFFELNNTDEDLGIHALIDGEAWRRLMIEDPNERRMLNIRVNGRLGRQGLTELAFESAEPNFEELDPEDFFRRFPEGEYEIEGLTLDWQEMESVAEVTHLIPAPVGNITVNGEEIPDDCDEGPVPAVSAPFEIRWTHSGLSHPDLGRTGEPIEIVEYQVVIEREEPTPLKFSVDLSPDVTNLVLPAGLLASGEEIKLEILVREDSGNRTAVESCFDVE